MLWFCLHLSKTSASHRPIWHEDDASTGGRLRSLQVWWDLLMCKRSAYGYFPNPEKTWTVVKNTHYQETKETFKDTHVNIRHYLGRKGIINWNLYLRQSGKLGEENWTFFPVCKNPTIQSIHILYPLHHVKKEHCLKNNTQYWRLSPASLHNLLFWRISNFASQWDAGHHSQTDDWSVPQRRCQPYTPTPVWQIAAATDQKSVRRDAGHTLIEWKSDYSTMLTVTWQTLRSTN